MTSIVCIFNEQVYSRSLNNELDQGKKMNDLDTEYDADETSAALGNLWGLAHMCFGLVSERRTEEDAIEFLQIRNTLRYIASQVKSIQSASNHAPKVVRKALESTFCVCSVVAADAAIEYAGQEFQSGMHWNDEITSCALGALCDALEVARQTVNDEHPFAKKKAVALPL